MRELTHVSVGERPSYQMRRERQPASMRWEWGLNWRFPFVGRFEPWSDGHLALTLVHTVNSRPWKNAQARTVRVTRVTHTKEEINFYLDYNPATHDKIVLRGDGSTKAFHVYEEVDLNLYDLGEWVVPNSPEWKALAERLFPIAANEEQQ